MSVDPFVLFMVEITSSGVDIVHPIIYSMVCTCGPVLVSPEFDQSGQLLLALRKDPLQSSGSMKN